MKKTFTQEEFDALPRRFGIKECPIGDYTAIRSFGERCRAVSPYWSFVYEPPFLTTGKILPTSVTRSYWSERLNLELKNCYPEIELQLKPLLPEILRRTDLTKCERRILESWQEKG